MNWFKKILSTPNPSEDIQPGDCIINRDDYPGLSDYFRNIPREVIRTSKGPDYAGGKFVFVKWANGEQGFYLNAVKKVRCC